MADFIRPTLKMDDKLWREFITSIERNDNQKDILISDEKEDVVVVSSDSEDENDNETIWSSYSKSNGFKKLWEKARFLIFHRLMSRKTNNKNSSLKTVVDKCPYQQLSNDLRKFQQDGTLKTEELTYLWKNVIQWLLAIKQSPSPLDLNYDEKFNLILVDFMVQYVNYTTKMHYMANNDQVQLIVGQVMQTMSAIFNGRSSLIIMTLLRIELKTEYHHVLDPIFRKYLTDRSLCQKSNEFVVYIRLVLCFRRWKIITQLKADREKINEIAVGKSIRYLRSESLTEILDLTTDPILPKSVPNFNDQNKAFVSISDLMRYAIERKASGTRILLYRSLDLENAISIYFRLYERLITGETVYENDLSEPCRSNMVNDSLIVSKKHQSVQAQPHGEHSSKTPHLSKVCDKLQSDISNNLEIRNSCNNNNDNYSISNSIVSNIERDLTDDDKNEYHSHNVENSKVQNKTRCRILSVVAKPSRKGKHCIMGVVSSTTGQESSVPDADDNTPVSTSELPETSNSENSILRNYYCDVLPENDVVQEARLSSTSEHVQINPMSKFKSKNVQNVAHLDNQPTFSKYVKINQLDGSLHSAVNVVLLNKKPLCQDLPSASAKENSILNIQQECNLTKMHGNNNSLVNVTKSQEDVLSCSTSSQMHTVNSNEYKKSYLSVINKNTTVNCVTVNTNEPNEYKEKNSGLDNDRRADVCINNADNAIKDINAICNSNIGQKDNSKTKLELLNCSKEPEKGLAKSEKENVSFLNKKQLCQDLHSASANENSILNTQQECNLSKIHENNSTVVNVTKSQKDGLSCITSSQKHTINSDEHKKSYLSVINKKTTFNCVTVTTDNPTDYKEQNRGLDNDGGADACIINATNAKKNIKDIGYSNIGQKDNKTKLQSECQSIEKNKILNCSKEPEKGSSNSEKQNVSFLNKKQLCQDLHSDSAKENSILNTQQECNRTKMHENNSSLDSVTKSREDVLSCSTSSQKLTVNSDECKKSYLSVINKKTAVNCLTVITDEPTDYKEQNKGLYNEKHANACIILADNAKIDIRDKGHGNIGQNDNTKTKLQAECCPQIVEKNILIYSKEPEKCLTIYEKENEVLLNKNKLHQDLPSASEKENSNFNTQQKCKINENTIANACIINPDNVKKDIKEKIHSNIGKKDNTKTKLPAECCTQIIENIKKFSCLEKSENENIVFLNKKQLCQDLPNASEKENSVLHIQQECNLIKIHENTNSLVNVTKSQEDVLSCSTSSQIPTLNSEEYKKSYLSVFNKQKTLDFVTITTNKPNDKNKEQNSCLNNDRQPDACIINADNGKNDFGQKDNSTTKLQADCYPQIIEKNKILSCSKEPENSLAKSEKESQNFKDLKFPNESTSIIDLENKTLIQNSNTENILEKCADDKKTNKVSELCTTNNLQDLKIENTLKRNAINEENAIKGITSIVSESNSKTNTKLLNKYLNNKLEKNSCENDSRNVDNFLVVPKLNVQIITDKTLENPKELSTDILKKSTICHTKDEKEATKVSLKIAKKACLSKKCSERKNQGTNKEKIDEADISQSVTIGNSKKLKICHGTKFEHLQNIDSYQKIKKFKTQLPQCSSNNSKEEGTFKDVDISEKETLCKLSNLESSQNNQATFLSQVISSKSNSSLKTEKSKNDLDNFQKNELVATDILRSASSESTSKKPSATSNPKSVYNEIKTILNSSQNKYLDVLPIINSGTENLHVLSNTDNEKQVKTINNDTKEKETDQSFIEERKNSLSHNDLCVDNCSDSSNVLSKTNHKKKVIKYKATTENETKQKIIKESKNYPNTNDVRVDNFTDKGVIDSNYCSKVEKIISIELKSADIAEIRKENIEEYITPDDCNVNLTIPTAFPTSNFAIEPINVLPLKEQVECETNNTYNSKEIIVANVLINLTKKQIENTPDSTPKLKSILKKHQSTTKKKKNTSFRKDILLYIFPDSEKNNSIEPKPVIIITTDEELTKNRKWENTVKSKGKTKTSKSAATLTIIKLQNNKIKNCVVRIKRIKFNEPHPIKNFEQSNENQVSAGSFNPIKSKKQKKNKNKTSKNSSSNQFQQSDKKTIIGVTKELENSEKQTVCCIKENKSLKQHGNPVSNMTNLESNTENAENSNSKTDKTDLQTVETLTRTEDNDSDDTPSEVIAKLKLLSTSSEVIPTDQKIDNSSNNITNSPDNVPSLKQLLTDENTSAFLDRSIATILGNDTKSIHEHSGSLLTVGGEQKVLSKNVLNDVKNVPTKVPRNIMADDESENSESEVYRIQSYNTFENTTSEQNKCLITLNESLETQSQEHFSLEDILMNETNILQTEEVETVLPKTQPIGNKICLDGKNSKQNSLDGNTLGIGQTSSDCMISGYREKITANSYKTFNESSPTEMPKTPLIENKICLQSKDHKQTSSNENTLDIVQSSLFEFDFVDDFDFSFLNDTNNPPTQSREINNSSSIQSSKPNNEIYVSLEQQTKSVACDSNDTNNPPTQSSEINNSSKIQSSKPNYEIYVSLEQQTKSVACDHSYIKETDKTEIAKIETPLKNRPKQITKNLCESVLSSKPTNPKPWWKGNSAKKELKSEFNKPIQTSTPKKSMSQELSACENNCSIDKNIQNNQFLFNLINNEIPSQIEGTLFDQNPSPQNIKVKPTSIEIIETKTIPACQTQAIVRLQSQTNRLEIIDFNNSEHFNEDSIENCSHSTRGSTPTLDERSKDGDGFSIENDTSLTEPTNRTKKRKSLSIPEVTPEKKYKTDNDNDIFNMLKYEKKEPKIKANLSSSYLHDIDIKLDIKPDLISNKYFKDSQNKVCNLNVKSPPKQVQSLFKEETAGIHTKIDHTEISKNIRKTSSNILETLALPIINTKHDERSACNISPKNIKSQQVFPVGKSFHEERTKGICIQKEHTEISKNISESGLNILEISKKISKSISETSSNILEITNRNPSQLDLPLNNAKHDGSSACNISPKKIKPREVFSVGQSFPEEQTISIHIKKEHTKISKYISETSSNIPEISNKNRNELVLPIINATPEEMSACNISPQKTKPQQVFPVGQSFSEEHTEISKNISKTSSNIPEISNKNRSELVLPNINATQEDKSACNISPKKTKPQSSFSSSSSMLLTSNKLSKLNSASITIAKTNSGRPTKSTTVKLSKSDQDAININLMKNQNVFKKSTEFPQRKSNPALPTTTTNTNLARTPAKSTINMATIKLSQSDEEIITKKLENYKQSLPETKLYIDHKENVRLINLHREKLTREILENKKRQQAEDNNRKKEAASSFNGSRSPTQYYPTPKRSNTKQTVTSTVTLSSSSSHRRIYVNKFSEIDKNDRAIKTTSTSTILTTNTAWEPRKSSNDEIFEYLDNFKKNERKT